MAVRYFAYPNLERLVFSRNRREETGPPRLLRFWYLLQGLRDRPLVEEVLSRWICDLGQKTFSRIALFRTIREGEGIWWRREGERLRIFSARELHKRFRLKLERERRDREGLLGTSREWHAAATRSAVTGYTKWRDVTLPPGPSHLGRQTGFSSRTVRRHLKDAKDRGELKPVWFSVRVDRNTEASEDYSKRYPHVAREALYAVRGGKAAGLYRRLPNGYRIGAPSEQEPRRESRLFRAIRQGLYRILGIQEDRILLDSLPATDSPASAIASPSSDRGRSGVGNRSGGWSPEKRAMIAL